MATLDTTTLSALRATVSGHVIVPADADYDRARSVWNGNIDRRPSAVVRCRGAEDVAATIALARTHNQPFTVRGGGHNYGGYAIADDTLMIDLSEMKAVTVDPAARRAVCGGGATWGDVDAATQAHGLAVPGGFVSHTGIGGLTLGGGVGWLLRKAGLTCDNLVAGEIVTADGRIRRFSADEHPDLFWAVRGGGGNFGVVTSFEYQLHPVGPLVHLGLFFWGVDQGAAALRFCRDTIATLPDEMGVFVAGLSAPPAPFVPAAMHFAPGYALAVVGFGSTEEHAATVAPIRAGLPPAWELVTSLPYTALQRMFDESAPWGLPAYEKALYIDHLSDAVIDVFTEHLPRKQSPLSFVPIFVMGGAYSRIADDASAFGGRRGAGLVFNISASVPAPEMFEAERAWVRDFWSALRPHAGSSGSYVNFMNEYEEDRVRAAYGATKYDRLARIKAEYDPDNVFRFNTNIKPASA
jgi:FAD/FMN-containing dehydrogenase